MNKENLPVYSSFIQGKIQLPSDPTGEWSVRSPSKSDEVQGKCLYSYAQIDELVKVASQGALHWRDKPADERRALILEAHQRLVENRQAWFQVASLELGRSNVDLNLEWKQFERWFEAFQKMPESISEPRGVTAFVGSYVWPLFYTLQFTYLNLFAGNSVVIKPSEKATLSTLKLAESIVAGSKLESLVHILVGEKEMGRRLVCHDQVQTVIFMGSFEVGMRVKQDTLSQPSKEVLLYLGAKNAVVICDDAKIERGLDTWIQDAFLSTGQHCRSASVFFVHESQYQKFCSEFHERAKQFKIGPPSSEAFAGPLIDDSMVDRYLKFSGISEREGAQILMRGKPLALGEKGNYVTPTLAAFEEVTPQQMKKSVSLQTEILSPHVSIVRYRSYEELFEVMAPMQHGLVASVWGENAERLNKIAKQLSFGQVLLNQSLLEWDPADSFQPRKKSGNHAYHGFKLMDQVTALKSVE